MITQHREIFLREAIRIGDELLKLSEAEGNMRSWTTVRMNEDRTFDTEVTPNLYCGISGIAHYLGELGWITGEEKYLRASEEGFRKAISLCDEGNIAPDGFYSGKVGVLWSMMLLAKNTGNNEMFDEAVRQTETLHLSSASPLCDILVGKAGTGLGLIQLYWLCRSEHLLQKIDSITGMLLKEVQFGFPGFFWERQAHCERGLCGFSHGSAGQGHFFIELAALTGNEAFLELAYEAFRFENHRFDKEIGNWPDFRKISMTEDEKNEDENQFMLGNTKWFRRKTDFSAWCHGAPGIGMARLNAWKRTGNEQMLAEAKIAAGRILNAKKSGSLIESPTLCHGHCGNAMLLIDLYHATGDTNYYREAEKTGLAVLEEFSKTGQYPSGYPADVSDLSLFCGDAGIGYFFLRLCEPEKISSVMCPSATESGHHQNVRLPVLHAAAEKIYRTVLEPAFPRSMCTIDFLFPGKTDRWFSENKTADASRFSEWLSSEPDFADNEIIREAITTDISILESDMIFPFSWHDARFRIHEKYIGNFPECTDELSLTSEPSILLTETGYDWSAANKKNWAAAASGEASSCYLLIRPGADGVSTYNLSALTYFILDFFLGNVSILSECRLHLAEIFEEDSEAGGQLDRLIKEQVAALLRDGMLLPAQHLQLPPERMEKMAMH